MALRTFDGSCSLLMTGAALVAGAVVAGAVVVAGAGVAVLPVSAASAALR